MKVTPKTPQQAWQINDEETARFIAGEVGGMFAKEVRQYNNPTGRPEEVWVPSVQINTLQGPKRAYLTEWVVKDAHATTIYTDSQFLELFDIYYGDGDDLPSQDVPQADEGPSAAHGAVAPDAEDNAAPSVA